MTGRVFLSLLGRFLSSTPTLAVLAALLGLFCASLVAQVAEVERKPTILPPEPPNSDLRLYFAISRQVTVSAEAAGILISVEQDLIIPNLEAISRSVPARNGIASEHLVQSGRIEVVEAVSGKKLLIIAQGIQGQTYRQTDPATNCQIEAQIAGPIVANDKAALLVVRISSLLEGQASDCPLKRRIAR